MSVINIIIINVSVLWYLLQINEHSFKRLVYTCICCIVKKLLLYLAHVLSHTLVQCTSCGIRSVEEKNPSSKERTLQLTHSTTRVLLLLRISVCCLLFSTTTYYVVWMHTSSITLLILSKPDTDEVFLSWWCIRCTVKNLSQREGVFSQWPLHIYFIDDIFLIIHYSATTWRWYLFSLTICLFFFC